MKKKILTSTLLFLLIFSTGCAGNHSADATTSSTPEVSVTLQKPKILDTTIPIDKSKVLQYIPNSLVEENLMQNIALFQGQLLCSCFVYNTEEDKDTLTLRLLDLDSGELICETELLTSPSYPAVIQPFEDKIVVSDAALGVIYVFNEQLEEIHRYSASGDSIYVSPSLTAAYCLNNDGITMIHLDDAKNTTKEILLENVKDLSPYSYHGEDVTFHYIDLNTPDKREYYASLHLESGKLEVFTIDDSFSGLEYNKGIWAGKLSSENQTYLIGSQQKLALFPLDLTYPSLQILGDTPHLILTSMDSNNQQVLTAYDTTGTFLSTCSLEPVSGSLVQNMIWHEGAQGYFFFVVTEEGYDQLYFWDFSKKIEGENLSLTSYQEKKPLLGTAVDHSYYERANKLSEKYGVIIKIADLCATDYLDKTAQQECKEANVSTALSVLENAFSSYPDGFWNQLPYGSYRTIEINLMGEISNKEWIEGYQPSAFVQQDDGKITMVLNINLDAALLEQNFYHESSHIIDKHLEHVALYKENALYSEETWASFNPTDFIRLNPECGGYYESYEIMPMDYFEETFTPYFISDYGKSFPTEDRATIFETAMTKNVDIFSDADNPLWKKLSYYSQCIRDTFDTSGWPEYTTWEEAIKRN